MVGFKEGTIGKQLQCLENSCTENDSSERKMENNSGGVQIENLVVGSELQVNNYGGWLKMESSTGLRENDGGELQMGNYSIRTTGVGCK